MLTAITSLISLSNFIDATITIFTKNSRIHYIGDSFLTVRFPGASSLAFG